jgi:succinylglutamate desuccinylase
MYYKFQHSIRVVSPATLATIKRLMPMPAGVVQKKSSQPGKTVAIFGGVHGNEGVGVEAVRWAVQNIELTRGTVFLVEANPPAIEANKRAIAKNLNRCFHSGNVGKEYEDRRARELMTILEQCDALLDIHASNNPRATPFIICEDESFPLARTLDFPIVSTGWDNVEPGATDGYMLRAGKIGICVECGYVGDAVHNLPRAQDTIRRFLAHYGLVEEVMPVQHVRQRLIRVHEAAHKRHANTSFTKHFADFESLVAGEVFAHDGDIEYAGKANDCIIFPHADQPIGAEIFILGTDMAWPSDHP